MNLETAVPNERPPKAQVADGLNLEPIVEQILNSSLSAPVQDLLERPSKNVRASLVWAGHHLAGDHQERCAQDQATARACERIAEALEAVHAGSLIIDDIQDGSLERRGAPSIHRIYGIPLALNAGNWLYFEPFEWIRNLQISERKELRIYRLFHEAMRNAHVGQALDLGTPMMEIDREQVRSICLSSLRMKSGALTALAIGAGSVLGDATDPRLQAAKSFGTEFGIALQMFDDIGNFNLPFGHPKRLEDLRLKRPTWLWALASEKSELEYRAFVEAVKHLPDETLLMDWIGKTGFIPHARATAEEHLRRTMKRLESELSAPEHYPQTLTILNAISERIRISYG